MSENPVIRWTRLNRIACGQCGEDFDASQLDPFTVTECPKCGTKQTVPAQLGQFLLVEQMGIGGMGAVYRAMDAALGRFVAIKVMKAEMGEDPTLVESFLREARAAAALNHPNIVQIYSCGQEQGQPYIVMELVSGGRLDLLMENGKKVNEIRLLEIALDVAEGLKAADEAGLVHGDIKPANILFDKSGRARIVDFGLAMFVNRQQEQGGVWGTPFYISPERARGGKADHRSDIYSLGATMFHALAGAPPFDGNTAADVVVARLKNPPPKLIDVEPSVQQRTSDLVERMMAADPMLRYPTSASLLADMRDTLAVVRAAHDPSVRAKQKKKKTRILIGVVLAVMVAGGGIAYFLTHRPPPKKGGRKPPVGRVTSGAKTNKTATAKTTAPKTNEQPLLETPSAPEEPIIEQNEGGRVRKTVAFFAPDAEKTLADALVALDANPAAANEQLAALAATTPVGSGGWMWVKTLQTLPLWAQGQTAEAEATLREVAESTIPQKRGHPNYMPPTLARYLLGELRDDQFTRERRDWPLWYGDLASLLKGAQALYGDDPEQALAALTAYARESRSTPAWVFALRPAAARWVNALEMWEIARRNATSQLNAGDLDGASSALYGFMKSAPPFLTAQTSALEKKIEDERARIAQAAQEERDRARQPIIQRDFDRIDEWVSNQIMQIAQQKDFRKISFESRKLEREAETPEGKERARIVREQLDRMEEIKTALIRDLEAAPFTQADRELGGEAVGATVLGVRVNMPGAGVVTRSWNQISPRLFVLLLSHVANNTAEEKVRANRLLSIAILSAYYGGYEAATNFAQQARELDPTLDPTIRRLLPEGPLSPPGGKS